MLKTIPKSQLVEGMYIEALNGSWVDHPFFKKSFYVNQDVIEKLRGSKVQSCVIDISKGKDVIQPSLKTHSNESREVSLQTKSSIRPSFMEERPKAERLIRQSKEVVEGLFNDVRLGNALSFDGARDVVSGIAESISRNHSVLTSLIRLKDRDDNTYIHSVSVSALMAALAREIGLSNAEIHEAGLAGLLHDFGKVHIPDEILNKPGTLSTAEFDLVRTHPVRGFEILSKSQELEAKILDVCLHHHEKLDGSGYPYNLKGEQISLFARMGAICDVYDAVTSDRPYKNGWNPAIALSRMAKWQESHLDANLFKAFVKMLGIYPIGSLVLLTSGRLAVVIEQDKKSLMMPVVKAFYSTKANFHISPELIHLSNSYDKIERPTQYSEWGIAPLDKLWLEQ